MNPITDWIRSGMESYNERETKFMDRVASMSINSVKLRDLKQVSHKSFGYYTEDPRSRQFDHFFVAHSTLKACPGGINSSAKAMEFYNELGEKKRQEMLAKYSTQE